MLAYPSYLWTCMLSKYIDVTSAVAVPANWSIQWRLRQHRSAITYTSRVTYAYFHWMISILAHNVHSYRSAHYCFAFCLLCVPPAMANSSSTTRCYATLPRWFSSPPSRHRALELTFSCKAPYAMSPILTNVPICIYIVEQQSDVLCERGRRKRRRCKS